MNKIKEHGLSSQEEAFTKYSVPKVLLKFIVPAALSQLTFLILNLADAFFVGRTGDTFQISAMTITFPVVMLASCIGTIFGAGGNANMAAELGKGKRERAKTFSAFSIYTAAVVTVIFSFLLLAVKEPLLYTIGANENSVGFCKDYLFWTFHIACVPLVLSQVFSQLFLAEGESQISAAGIAGAGLLNVILDPVFIFGFHMGVAGAGLATCVANYISFAFYLIMYYTHRKTTVVCFHLRYYRVGGKVCMRVLSVGIPAGLVLLFMDVCDFTRNYYFNVFGGQVELAAWGVVQKIGNAFMQICVGIAQGLRPVVAYNYSSNLLKRVRSIINGGIAIMAGWIAACLVLVALAPTFLVNLLIPSGESVPVAVSYLRIWIFCIIGFGFVELFNAVFQSMGRWKISVANTVINKGFMLTPVMVLLANWKGIGGIIISQPITEDLTAVVLFIIYLAVMKKEASSLE
ncbi:MAG: MATE family efflux transporter [Eubacteriales bacterium]|nr:MATE family efflux transporter [Eubacteriales bacterium]